MTEYKSEKRKRLRKSKDGQMLGRVGESHTRVPTQPPAQPRKGESMRHTHNNFINGPHNYQFSCTKDTRDKRVGELPDYP